MHKIYLQCALPQEATGKYIPIEQIRQIIKKERTHGIQENGNSKTKKGKGNHQNNNGGRRQDDECIPLT